MGGKGGRAWREGRGSGGRRQEQVLSVCGKAKDGNKHRRPPKVRPHLETAAAAASGAASPPLILAPPLSETAAGVWSRGGPGSGGSGSGTAAASSASCRTQQTEAMERTPAVIARKGGGGGGTAATSAPRPPLADRSGWKRWKEHPWGGSARDERGAAASLMLRRHAAAGMTHRTGAHARGVQRQLPPADAASTEAERNPERLGYHALTRF